MGSKPKATIPKLIGSIVIDLIGAGSALIPFGGISDFIVGPATAMYIKTAYGSTGLAWFGLAEEILFFDFIPSASIAWFWTRFVK